MLASPFGMALVAATVAHGAPVVPRLIEDEPTQALVPATVPDPAVLDVVRPMMRAVVTEGSATALAGLGDEERAVLLRSLSLMRKNLIAACERPPEAVPSEDRDPENTPLRRRA